MLGGKRERTTWRRRGIRSHAHYHRLRNKLHRRNCWPTPHLRRNGGWRSQVLGRGEPRPEWKWGERCRDSDDYRFWCFIYGSNRRRIPHLWSYDGWLFKVFRHRLHRRKRRTSHEWNGTLAPRLNERSSNRWTRSVSLLRNYEWRALLLWLQ